MFTFLNYVFFHYQLNSINLNSTLYLLIQNYAFFYRMLDDFQFSLFGFVLTQRVELLELCYEEVIFCLYVQIHGKQS